MQVATHVYSLHTVSSSEIHLKAVHEMRRVRFQKFKLTVLHHLAKKLKIGFNYLRRPYIEISYTVRYQSTRKHTYFLESDDGLQNGSIGGMKGFLFYPPVGRETFKNNISHIEVEKRFKFGPHLRELHKFLTVDKNVKHKEIFLRSSPDGVLDKLRERIQEKSLISFEDEGYTVYDVANILKLYLEQMDEPLFRSNYYVAYENISKLEKIYLKKLEIHTKKKLISMLQGRLWAPNSSLIHREKIIAESIQLIVQLLTKERRELLGYIVDILATVHANHEYNQMSATNLGKIFAPLLFCPRGLPTDVKLGTSKEMSPVVTRIIKLGRKIFDPPKDLIEDAWEQTRKERIKLTLPVFLSHAQQY